MTTPTTHEPDSRRKARPRWPWRTVWIGIACASVIVFGFGWLDRAFYINVSLKLNTPPPTDWDFYHETIMLWDALRFFGHGLGVSLAATFIWCFRPSGRRRALLAVFAVGVAALTAYLLQGAIGRLRPGHGPTAWAFASPLAGLTENAPVGFPSGEAATGFALAFVLRRQFRKLGHAFLALAALVAVTRSLFGMHYVSDVVAGAVVGRLVAREAMGAGLHVATRLRWRGSIRSSARSKSLV